MKIEFKDGTFVDTEQKDYSYNLLIKKRLCEWRDKFEKSNDGLILNYAGIAEAMYSRFHIHTTANKIGKMFNIEDDRAIQLPELMALAQMFNIPIWDICEHPGAASSNMNYGNLVRRKTNKDTSVHPLDNYFYEGEYWCYFFSSFFHEGVLKPVEESSLEEARMMIEVKMGRTILTLEEKTTKKKFDGTPLPSFTLTGDLYLFDHSDIAYSFVSDEKNQRSMAIMFRYISLSKDIRYYIPAGILCPSQNEIHTPLFHKMAIFKTRLDYSNEEVANVLRGILTLNSTPLVLDQNSCKELVEKYPILETILCEEKAMENCFVFSESLIYDSLYRIKDSNEKMKILLELRKNSLLPAHEVVLEKEYFTKFIKEFQLKEGR